MITRYHVTLRRNLKSIQKRGLLTSRSTGKRKAVWCVTKDRLTWATMHVARRHNVALDELVVLHISLDGTRLSVGPAQSWFYTADVPPESILSVSQFMLVSQ